MRGPGLFHEAFMKYRYRLCPGLRMASPSQTCSPLRLSSLPTAIGRPGYSADDSFIPRTPDLSRAKISASFLLWFAYGEATTPAWCNTFQLLRHFTLNEKSLTRRTNEAMRWHRRLRTTQSCVLFGQVKWQDNRKLLFTACLPTKMDASCLHVSIHLRRQTRPAKQEPPPTTSDRSVVRRGIRAKHGWSEVCGWRGCE